MKKTDYAAMAQQLNLTPSRVVEAIDDLNEWVCLHDKFVNLQQIIMNAIAGRSRDLLIVVIGPARVGKTTLFDSIAGMVDALAQQNGKRRGCFRFTSPPPDSRGRFNWTAAILESYALSNEILPLNKITYGDIADGAPPRRNPNVLSTTAAEQALFRSFIKNVQMEKLFTIVDEGNTIPVILSDLQVTRAIHDFKYIVSQTRQPLLIGGTSAIRHIVEHDTQLKVRTKILFQDPYGEDEKDEEEFCQFIVEMETRLGPKFCELRSLSSHSKEIRRGVDGRCGLAVRVATDALSQHGETRLNWKLYKTYLDRLVESSEEDLILERHLTRRPIISAAEAPITRKETRDGKSEKKVHVGARKNTNASNHPRRSTGSR